MSQNPEIPEPETPVGTPPRRHWLRYARIGIACVLLILLLPTFTQPEFFHALASVNIVLVLVSFVLSVASVVSKARRWGIVLRARGMPASNRYLLMSYFISMFFNNFLPSGMGGDAVRAYESARTTGRGSQAISAVILERGTGMVTIFAYGSILSLFAPNIPLPIALLAHGLFIGTLLAVFLLWQDFTAGWLNWIGARVVARLLGGRLTGIWDKIVGVYFDFHSYRHEWRLIRALFVQSAITQLFSITSQYTLLRAFDFAPPLGSFIAVTGIATAIDLVPISLNGLGIREGVYVYFLGLLSVPSPVAIAYALVMRVIVLAQALLGGLTFLWRSAQPAPIAPILPISPLPPVRSTAQPEEARS